MNQNNSSESVKSGASDRVIPVIDRNRCEGKEDCVRVCPFDVFSIATLQPADRKGLSLRGKIKGWAHGWKQAVIARPDACEACGLCVAACPEKALTLRKTEPDS